MNHRLLLAIPTYNCERQVGRVLSELPQLAGMRIEETLVIDNCSTDETARIARDCIRSTHLKKARVVINRENHGLGGTHKLAIDYAIKQNFDYLIVLHGDNQADSGELPRLLTEIEASTGIDAVLGIRFTEGSRLLGYSRFRALGNTLINTIYSVILNEKVEDLGSGLNIFSVRKLSKIPYIHFSNGCDFNIYLLIHMLAGKWNIRSVPITWRSEDQRSNVNALTIGAKALRILLSWKLASLPIHPLNKSLPIESAKTK